MNRFLPIGVALVLMTLVAVVQGYWTDRWGQNDPGEVLRRVDALAHLPHSFGSWDGTDNELDDAGRQQLKVAKVSGIPIQRTYRNRETGQEVNIYLATGKPRNIAVHTPDKCYEAAGFRMAEDQIEVPFKYGENHKAGTYMAHFRKEEAHGAPLHLKIYWTWNADNRWEAPKFPKVEFANYPALYKLYVIRQIHSAETLTEDPTVAFLKEFLPFLDAHLYGPTSGKPAAPPVAKAAAA